MPRQDIQELYREWFAQLQDREERAMQERDQRRHQQEAAMQQAQANLNNAHIAGIVDEQAPFDPNQLLPPDPPPDPIKPHALMGMDGAKWNGAYWVWKHNGVIDYYDLNGNLQLVEHPEARLPLQEQPPPPGPRVPRMPDRLRGLNNVRWNGNHWCVPVDGDWQLYDVAGHYQGRAAGPEAPAGPEPMVVVDNQRVNLNGVAGVRRREGPRPVAIPRPAVNWAQAFANPFNAPPRPERARPRDEDMPKQPDAKPLNIDKYLDTVQNRIYRVGIELEGGWIAPPQGMNIVRDGSIKELQAPAGQLLAAVGEIPSYAMEPVKVRPWMKKYYPQVVNHTCGLHVHMSFMSALHYEWLIAPEYQETVLEYLRKWGEREGVNKNSTFWNRVSGKHEHCIKLYWPDHQIAVDKKHFDNDHGLGRPGNRYTAINYCWGQHNTLECRVLPMFKDPEMGIKAVMEVLRITNACLVALARKEKPLKADFFVEDDAIYQDHRKEIV